MTARPTHVAPRQGLGPPSEPVAPLLKWPGGKSGELRQIRAAIPPSFERYAEPFLGGGAVFFGLPAVVPATLNDTSAELMTLYRLVRDEDPRFHETLESIDRWWQDCTEWTATGSADVVAAWRHRRRDSRFARSVRAAVERSVPGAAALVPEQLAHLGDDVAHAVRNTVPRKLIRMRQVELDRRVDLPHGDVRRNVEGAYKAAIYTTLRAEYNRGRVTGRQDHHQGALFLFLREYAYAAMFRFNARGEFNVPYGGITYNRKDFAGKLQHLRSPGVLSRLREADLTCVDFATSLARFAPTRDDFVFLDPPYDSEFSEYDRRTFSAADHGRLSAILRTLDARFLLVVKATPMVERLYPADAFAVTAFDKTYMWTIKQRNDRAATHLMVSNYDLPAAARERPAS